MASSEPSQYRYKIILMGDSGVGKTSLFKRIQMGRFDVNQSAVQGADLYTYSTTIDDDQINVSLWDTGGGGGARFRTTTFYRNADGAFLVYSLEDIYTFDNLQEWIDEASHHIVDMDSFQWALIGNKCDLGFSSIIGLERVKSLCDKLQTKVFHKVSAKTGLDVMNAFDGLVSAIHKSRHLNQQSHAPPQICDIIRLNTIDTDDLVSNIGKQPTDQKKPRKRSCC